MIRVVAFASAFLLAASPPATSSESVLSPNEIVATASDTEWVTIAPDTLVVMDLVPGLEGKRRRIIIQLMPQPFSQGWVSNIRTLIAARWYDGTSINRVQDNYVVQWGDATEKKSLPNGMATISQSEYVASRTSAAPCGSDVADPGLCNGVSERLLSNGPGRDVYGNAGFWDGWPVSRYNGDDVWPVHCYAMVGVGRGMPPDTGTGAELYTVIGHAPRHLDRNIALVGRVIEGIEHLSSLPRGTGPLGFYEAATERTVIASIRMGNAIAGLPRFEYLSTESATFAGYAEARANRRDAFFIQPALGADICNVPVPIRRAP